jgi:small subunit ribosomal protein S16
MLVIRMQRTGRKGHAQFRVVVQDSRRTPSSGRVVANLGSFDPHTKQTTLNKEKAEYYLSNGAQPSERVIRLLKSEKIKLPVWVKDPADRKRDVKNPDKLRRNQPAEEPVKEEATEPIEEPEVEESKEIVEDTANPEDSDTKEAEEKTE